MSAFEIMSNLHDSAYDDPSKNSTPNVNRYSGGIRNIHPYISGYWHLLITIPTILSGKTSEYKFFNNILGFTAETFTPPSRTLTTSVIHGLGGVTKNIVTGQTINNTFTIGFREYTKLPIIKIFNLWTSLVYPQTGLSLFSQEHWDESIYKSECYVLITDMSCFDYGGSDVIFNKAAVQEVYYFYGVFPENNPQDIPQDISSNDSAQIPVTFKFDGWPLTSAELDLDSVMQKYNSNVFNTVESSLSMAPGYSVEQQNVVA
jgi:hypothetical protein